MATLSGGVRNRPTVIYPAILFLALAIVTVCGCEAGPRAYRHGNLPAEYAATTVDTASTIDTSRLATVSVDSNLIDVGDLIEVSISTPVDEALPEPAPFRVDSNGMVSVPPIGAVAIAGLHPNAAEAAIAEMGVMRRMYVRHPQVTVNMKEQMVNRVQVVGQVRKQGEVELRRGSSTLLAALMAAGGLTENASLEIEIRRPAQRRGPPGAFHAGLSPASGGVEQASYEVAAAGEATTEKVNLLQAIDRADKAYHLNDGDVVHVGRRPPLSIHVIGLVRKSGEFPIKPNEEVRVLDVLAKAGWTKLPIADKISISRRVSDQEDPIVIRGSLREMQKNGEANIRLMPGDIVSVEETITTIAFDTMKTFFRISFGGSLGNLDLFQ